MLYLYQRLPLLVIHKKVKTKEYDMIYSLHVYDKVIKPLMYV